MDMPLRRMLLAAAISFTVGPLAAPVASAADEVTPSGSGKVEGTIRARHVGACPSGQKVGDEVLAGDVITNVLAR